MSQRCAYMSERCLERAPKKYAITVPRTLLLKTPSDLSIQYNKFRRYAPTAPPSAMPPHSTSRHATAAPPPSTPCRRFRPTHRRFLTTSQVLDFQPLRCHLFTATSLPLPTTAAPSQHSLSLTPPAAFTSSPRHPQPATTVTPAATHSQHLRCRYHQRL